LIRSLESRIVMKRFSHSFSTEAIGLKPTVVNIDCFLFLFLFCVFFSGLKGGYDPVVNRPQSIKISVYVDDFIFPFLSRVFIGAKGGHDAVADTPHSRHRQVCHIIYIHIYVYIYIYIHITYMYIYIHTCEEHSIRNLLREAFRVYIYIYVYICI